MACVVNAQDLKTTINEVLSTNPTVVERLKNYNITKEDITTAKAGYYPKIDLSLGGGYENSKREDYNGDTTLTKDGKYTDTLGLDVYQNSLTYTQNLFNGFATTHQVAQQQNRTISAAYSYIEKANNTAFDATDKYLQLLRQKELLQTAKENVEIDKKIFQKVKKLYGAGLTTLSEVNKIESSLALAKSNYVVQQNSLADAKYNMQSILGRYLDVDEMVKPSVDVKFPKSAEEAAQYALRHNPSLLVGRYNIKLAQERYKEKRAPFYPKLDVEISQSMNNNLSGSQGNDDRFRAMAYLRYNFFNGFADQAELQKSVSQIHQEVESSNITKREVIKKLNLAWEANEKLSKQLKHLIAYKEFSKKTLTLYAKEYDLGRRSLLDVLSSQNDFIRAKAQIINTQYSILFAKYRILDAMGILVSSVADDSELYSNVGLKGRMPKNSDDLPIVYDKDKDLVSDTIDICSNSLSEDMKDIYGCKHIYEGTAQIERYSGFLFDDLTTDITNDGREKLKNLIKQLEPYGYANVKFDILGHADDDSTNSEDLMKLSKQRALKVKDILEKAGFLRSNITIHPQADFAPAFSDESGEGVERNNRVDIVVRKLK